MRTVGYYWCKDGTWHIFFWDGSIFRSAFGFCVIESAMEEINEERIPEPKHKAA